jgi:hypothetical protein
MPARPGADKAASTEPKPKKQRMRWVSQIRQAYQAGRKGDPRLGLWVAGSFLVVLAVFVALGFVLGSPVFWGLLGVLAGATAAMYVFGRRVERSVYRQVDGTPGATLQALSTLRRGFSVEAEPVAGNRNQDLVFRVTGKCGVVLVGEGSSPARVANLLGAERRRHQRVLGEIPIHELQAGSGEGQVPLPKLSRTVMRLPRTLKGPQMTELDHRLRAVAVTHNAIPIPKGPLPRGVKMPRAPR